MEILVILLETHRLLTVIGALLLVATFLINNNYVENNPIVDDNDTGSDIEDGDILSFDFIGSDSGEFNYAYVTGVLMIGVLAASFVIFSKNKMKRGLAS